MVTSKIKTVVNDTKLSREVGVFCRVGCTCVSCKREGTQGMVPSHMAAIGKWGHSEQQQRATALVFGL